jgi:hypothetical protein
MHAAGPLDRTAGEAGWQRTGAPVRRQMPTPSSTNSPPGSNSQRIPRRRSGPSRPRRDGAAMAAGSPITAADPNGETRQTKPFSMRLADGEKDLLPERAGRWPLGTYIGGVILAAEVRTPRRSAGPSVRDHRALARVPSCLGRSRLSNNLNPLARTANIGVCDPQPPNAMPRRDRLSSSSRFASALSCGRTSGRPASPHPGALIAPSAPRPATAPR